MNVIRDLSTKNFQSQDKIKIFLGHKIQHQHHIMDMNLICITTRNMIFCNNFLQVAGKTTQESFASDM
jgi:hypothetical protein